MRHSGCRLRAADCRPVGPFRPSGSRRAGPPGMKRRTRHRSGLKARLACSLQSVACRLIVESRQFRVPCSALRIPNDGQHLTLSSATSGRWSDAMSAWRVRGSSTSGDFDVALVVDVIEVEHREQAGIRAPAPQVRASGRCSAAAPTGSSVASPRIHSLKSPSTTFAPRHAAVVHEAASARAWKRRSRSAVPRCTL